jgi:threonine synthase
MNVREGGGSRSLSSMERCGMEHVMALQCVRCGRQYTAAEVEYTCPACGVGGILEVLYDYKRIAASFHREALAANPDRSIWRYRPLLPVEPSSPVSPLHVGDTPLYPVDRLRLALGMPRLWVKDDGRNPTASLKDRASAVGIVKALERGAGVVTCASTGNAAASWAGLSASLGLPCTIFVPKTAPQGKLAQLLIFGATVFPVEGTYDDAFALAIQATARFGWYNRNTAYNPYLVEGKKTVALELAEQMNWQVPDVVFVPVGDGCILSGVFKGFVDLLSLGWIERMPTIIGVQSEGSRVLETAWRTHSPLSFAPSSTVADSIAAGMPANGEMALRDLYRWDGKMVAVPDAEILAAMRLLGEKTGIFAEPAAAASLAGLQAALNCGWVGEDQIVVLLVTGNGLKDVGSALKTVTMPNSIPPTLEAVEKALQDQTGIRSG